MMVKPQVGSTSRRSTSLMFTVCMLGTVGLVACGSEPEAATNDTRTAEAAVGASSTEPSDRSSTTGAASDDTTTAPAAEPEGSSVGSSGEAEICPAAEYPAFGAFDLASGELQWSTCSPDEAYRYVIGASDEVVVMLQSGDDGSADAIALESASGAELWRQSTVRGLGFAPGPVVGQGTVVVETGVEGPPFVMGVDASTGAERWRLQPGESVVGLTDSIVVIAPSLPIGQPDPTALAAGIRGVDRATGVDLWTSDVRFDVNAAAGTAYGGAAISDGTIFVPTGASMAAVDLATGNLLWDAPPLDQPVASGGTVLGSEPTQGAVPSIRSIDDTTGDELWSAPGRVSYGIRPTAGDGIAVVMEPMTSAELIAYDLVTGQERWRTARTSAGEPQLVVGESVVLLWEADLGVISTADGSPTWSLTEPLHSPLMNSVGANSSTAFVAVNSLPWGD